MTKIPKNGVGKRPASQWYWSDWLRDPAVRASSLEARGLWMDMLALMHEGRPYGHLTVGGEAVTDAQLARMVGESPAKVKKILAELDRLHVYSRTEDGTIYSRRMVRDETVRNGHAEFGKLGGNPKLGVDYNRAGFVYAMERESDGAIKIGISASPGKRIYKVRQQYPGIPIKLVAQMPVEDMGGTEAELHSEYAEWADGEWFHLSPALKDRLLLRLKVNGKGKQTPSSAVASSSASASASAVTTTNELNSVATGYNGTPFARFIARFYETATEERQNEVRRQLDATLTEAGARLDRNTRAKANDWQHLVKCLTAVINDPPDKPDVAVVWVLKKLLDPVLDAKNRTMAEATDARLKEQVAFEERYRNAKRKAAKAWSENNAEDLENLETRARQDLPGDSGFAETARKSWVLERIAERIEFPSFEKWEEHQQVPA